MGPSSKAKDSLVIAFSWSVTDYDSTVILGYQLEIRRRPRDEKSDEDEYCDYSLND